MTDSAPQPKAPPLRLPPAALHTLSSDHVDSIDFVERERHRVAHELEVVGEPNTPHPPSPSLCTYRSSAGASVLPNGNGVSRIPTATDSQGPEGSDTRRSLRLRRMKPHWYDPIVKFWKRHISLTIDEGPHRDHLALERTFLGYLRTSLQFAMTGVIIAQLFTLQRTINPSRTFGFYKLGTPLAVTFISLAIVVLLLGAYRFWKQQNAMVRGKIYSGGWEISSIMLLAIVLCLVLFSFMVAVDVSKEIK